MSRGSLIALLVAALALVGLVFANLGDTEDPEQTLQGEAETVPTEDPAPPAIVPLESPPPVLGQALDLTNLAGWLQTDATEFADFDGQVRVVQFWTFGCRNCKNTLENMSHLYTQFEPQGLEVIGVHSPEFDYEANVESIAQAAIDLGVTWPIALDTDKTNFRSWQSGRRFWPRTFVIDQEGQIRFDRIGEGGYDELNSTVAYLVAAGS